MGRVVFAYLAAAVAALVLLSACAPAPAQPAPAGGQQPPAAAPKKGGTMRIALSGDPPSLDIHTTTATDVYMIGWHIAEQLYTFDDKYDVIPMLVDNHTVTPQGTVWTFYLRKGVKFHNGQEMTAADVVASLQRWGRMSGAGKVVMNNVTGLEAKDTHLVEMRLKQPSGGLLINLATPGQGPFIYPKSEIDQAKDASGKDTPLKNIIGTGPYRLVEWQKDRHIKLQRFADYAFRGDAGPNGFGGRKGAYADELLFIPVPDAQTRLAGLQAGDYDLTVSLNQTQYAEAQKAGLTTTVLKPSSWLTFVFNKKQGPFTNKALRQAFLASLDMGPIMEAAVGDKDFYRLDPGVAQVEQKSWHTTAGGEVYNKRDLEKAKKLMAEGGYKGEKIRWILDQTSDYYRKAVTVGMDQAKQAGWNIEFVGMDWATMIQQRSKPEVYEIFTTGITPKYDPVQIAFVPASWPGWWESKRKDELIEKINVEMNPTARKQFFEEFHKVFWDEVPVIKVGDVFTLRAGRKNVQNQPWQFEFHYWNVWKQ